jgi:hypothetical protein
LAKSAVLKNPIWSVSVKFYHGIFIFDNKTVFESWCNNAKISSNVHCMSGVYKLPIFKKKMPISESYTVHKATHPICGVLVLIYMISTCARIDKYTIYLEFKCVWSSTPQVSCLQKLVFCKIVGGLVWKVDLYSATCLIGFADRTVVCYFWQDLCLIAAKYIVEKYVCKKWHKRRTCLGCYKAEIHKTV